MTASCSIERKRVPVFISPKVARFAFQSEEDYEVIFEAVDTAKKKLKIFS